MTSPFYCVRFLISARENIIVPGQQGALLYALMCQANADPPAYPTDFLLDAPELTRTSIFKGQTFAFGGSFFANDGLAASQFVHRIARGIQTVGTSGRPRRKGLGGNFELSSIEDLVANYFNESQQPTKIDWKDEYDTGEEWLQNVPIDLINKEIQAAQFHDSITLRFSSPLRMERARKLQRSGHRFLDDRFFDAGFFARRVLKRLETIGILPDDPELHQSFSDDSIDVLENRLVWVDMGYGAKRKTLGGLVGDLTVKVNHPHVLAALVWAQYSRLGKNTHFGFGRYRIVELGEDPFECKRSKSLLDIAWGLRQKDKLTAQAGLESGVLNHTIAEIQSNQYRPDPCQKITIGKEAKRRELTIPSKRDRILQRLVLEVIGSGVDQLFESSSFAWRKGLGRHSSAKAVQRAFQQGFRFAIRADFDRFFDSIDREKLFDRLNAYVGERRVTDLIKQWIEADATLVKTGARNLSVKSAALSDQSSAPFQFASADKPERPARSDNTKGIPTGSPLSPFLGNLMLDRFDEQIAESGGRLVRYGDDFLILFKEESDAQFLLTKTQDCVAELALKLNESEEAYSDLTDPFDFLGFEFSLEDKWVAEGFEEPRLIDELGWKDASENRIEKEISIQIDGETGKQTKDFGFAAIIGPAVRQIEHRGGRLICRYSDGKADSEISINDLEHLVVLGNVDARSSTLNKLLQENVHVVLADDRGRSYGVISGDSDLNAELVINQVKLQADDGKRLEIAKSLVQAKIYHYSLLAKSLHQGRALAERLQKQTKKIDTVSTIEQLIGVEGFAAKLWYEKLGSFLGRKFSFEKRVSPNALDPINVLLNIGYTLMFRLNQLAIRANGLCSSLGILHQSTPRFQALATDLQEPFRFLVDRAVIQASHHLNPNEFQQTDSGQYSTRLSAYAARYFQKLLWDLLNLEVTSVQSESTVSYLTLISRQCRALRRQISNLNETQFRAFQVSGG